jgi:Flp pilus assembly protein TadG
MTITSKSNTFLRRFHRDDRGNVAIITALTAIPLLIASGVAIDVARSSRSENALQVAVDAAALAVAASDKVDMSGLTDAQKASRKAELKKLAENFLRANYSDQGQDVTVNIDVTDTVITVDGTKVYPTTLMNLAGIRSVDLSAHAEVNLQGGIAENIEIALVMDTTGSMNQNNKLVDAKAAAKQLIQTVLGDAASDDKVKFALVPFSGSVNVGSDKRNSGWIDATGKASVSNVNFITATYHNMQAWDDMKYTSPQGVTGPLPWNGCVEARLGNYAVDDTPPSATTPDTLFTPYMAPDESSTGNESFPNSSYVSSALETTGLSSKDAKSDAKRQANDKKYVKAAAFTSLTASSGPWYNCAASTIVPLTSSRATIEAGIDAMVARGNTVLPEGMAWGWRVLSPNMPYPEGASYTDKKWRKVVVMMTDGMNDVSVGANSVNESAYTAYGYVTAAIAKNRFGTTTSSQAITKLNDKFLSACTGLKALAEMRDNPKDRSKKVPSIEIYTIAFQAPEASKTLLKSCATSEGYFIDAANGTQLKDAFKAIGARLKTMFLSK